MTSGTAALFWSLAMTVSAIFGYQVLKSFYSVMVPVLLAALVYALIHVMFFSEAGLPALLAWQPERPMSYITGITLVVGPGHRGF
jgi:purine-cytosine permease-like protein